MKLLRSAIFLLGLLLSSTVLFAQTGGKTHTVLRGETLYSISKTYDITVEDLSKANPDVSGGLKAGTILSIPSKEDQKKVAEEKFVLHKVEKGETLYSITKQYSISLQTLLEKNPDIIDGLTVGVSLKIPDVTGLLSKGVQKAANETELPTSTNINSADEIQAGLFLPLSLEANFASTDSSDDASYSLISESVSALEFYEGFKIASDSLAKSGLKLKLHVYDTRKSEVGLKSDLAKAKNANLNLVFGPLQASDMPNLLTFSNEQKIPIVVPFYLSRQILSANKSVFSASASVRTQCEGMAGYLREKHKSDNILFVSTGLAKEAELIQFFLNGLDTAKHYKQFIYPKTGFKEIKESFSKKGKNILIVCSSDESNVNNLLFSLKACHDSSIVVVGLPTWDNFPSLDYSVLEALHLHSFATSSLNLTSPATTQFRQTFRDRYLSEPSNYACQGYDLALYFLEMYKNYGTRFSEYILNKRGWGIQSEYNFKRDGESGGYENSKVYIYTIQELSQKMLNH